MSIITSHVYNPEALIDVANHSTRKSLMIYLHKDETDRIMLSAIKQVIMAQCATNDLQRNPVTEDCKVNKGKLINLIKARTDEIEYNGRLTCGTYGSFEDMIPTWFDSLHTCQ